MWMLGGTWDSGIRRWIFPFYGVCPGNTGISTHSFLFIYLFNFMSFQSTMGSHFSVPLIFLFAAVRMGCECEGGYE
eukprot:jgi/Botrbrau1/3001/Bobra.0026s0058.1